MRNTYIAKFHQLIKFWLLLLSTVALTSCVGVAEEPDPRTGQATTEDTDSKGSVQDLLAYAKGSLLAQSVVEATDSLYHTYGLTPDWVVDFSSIKANIAGKGYSLRFVNPVADKQQWLTTQNPVFQKYQQAFQQAIDEGGFELQEARNGHFKLTHSASAHNSTAHNSTAQDASPQEVSTHGASEDHSSEFFLKAIFDFLRVHAFEEAQIEPDSENTQLVLAVKLHVFAATAKKALKFGGKDVLKLSKVINILSGDVVDEAQLFAKIDSVAGKVGLGLGALNVVIDLMALTSADTPEQRAIFATQLGFDSANFGLATASYGLSFLEFGTASSALGVLGVPLAGLGIGITALVDVITKANGQALAYAKYFLYCDQSYKTPYKWRETDQGNKILDLANQAVITELDLTNDQQVRLNLATQFVYRTAVYYPGGYNNSSHTGVNHAVRDKSQAVPVKDALGYSKTTEKIQFDDLDAVVLPVTPVSYIRYGYGPAWGIYRRNDAELQVVRRMANDYPFLFLYWGPDESAIRSMHFEYQKTPITLNLGKKSLTLATPEIPKEWHNNLNYQLNGMGGSYSLVITEGAQYQIRSGSKEESWLIDASNVSSQDRKYHKGVLSIGGVDIDLSGDFSQIYVKDSSTLSVLDRDRSQFAIVSLDESLWVKNHQADYQAFLREHDFDPKHQGYVKITHHKHSEDPSLEGVAWFDTRAQKIIEPSIAVQQDFGKTLQLLGVDALGKRFYWVPARQQRSKVASQGNVRLQGHLVIETDSGYDSDSSIGDASIQRAGFAEGAAVVYLDNGLVVQLTDWKTLKIRQLDLSRWPLGLQDERLQGYALAQIVTLVDTGSQEQDNANTHTNNNTNQRTHSWFIPKNGQRQLGQGRIAGELVGVSSEKQSLQLIGWQFQGNGKALYYLYDGESRTLYTQRGVSVTSAQQLKISGRFNEPKRIEIPDLKQVYALGQGIFIHKENDEVYRLDVSGKLHLSGIWLQQQQQGQSLSELVKQDHSESTIEILNAKDSEGRSQAFWYDVINDVMVRSIAGEGKALAAYIGFNADTSKAYVLNKATGVLYSHQVASRNLGQFDWEFKDSKALIIDQGESNYSPIKVDIDEPLSLAYQAEDAITAVSRDGVMFFVDASDQVFIAGVNDAWLKRHTHNLTQSLSDLVRRYQPLTPYLQVGGLSKAQWFDANNAQLIKAQVLHKEHFDVAQFWLGKDSDNGAFYTFSPDLNGIYRTQAGISRVFAPVSLAKVFGQRLLIIGSDTKALEFPRIPVKEAVFVAKGANTIHLTDSDFEHFSRIDLYPGAYSIHLSLQVAAENYRIASTDGVMTLTHKTLDHQLIIHDQNKVRIDGLK